MLQLIDKYGNVYGEGPIIVTTKDGKLKTNVTTSTSWGSITGILSNQTDLQSALNAKQANLVSGTNIKTINGSSILGSGNLVITGGVSSVSGVSPIASSGGATPSISIATANTSTTGAITSIDWNRFNDKQNALVSGTNIRTINGLSILGAGDIIIGGGGSSTVGVHVSAPPRPNTVISAQLTTAGYSSTGQLANRMVLYPFIPQRNFVAQNFILRVATAQANALAQIVMYSDTNGNPDYLIYSSTNLNCSTIGNKTAEIEYSFFAGNTYWIGYWGNGTPSVFTMPAGNMLNIRSAGAIPNPSSGLTVVTPYSTIGPPVQLTGFAETNSAMPFIGITILNAF